MTRIAMRPPEQLVDIVADHWTAPYWEAAREGRLTCCRCARCGHFRMPPSPYCPACRSQDVEWPTLPGTGTIYTYTVVERAVLPGTQDSVPYVPAVVTLDGAGAARLITNIVDSPIDRIAVDAPVRVIFDRIGDASLPRFRLETRI